MDILSFLNNHKHYWGIPHARAIDDRIIQTCYECGAEREVKIDLRPSPFLDPISSRQQVPAPPMFTLIVPQLELETRSASGTQPGQKENT